MTWSSVRAWLVRTASERRRRGTVGAVWGVLMGALVGLLGYPLLADAWDHECHEGFLEGCEEQALLELLGVAFVEVGALLVWTSGWLMASFLAQRRVLRADAAEYGPRLQSVRDWYALGRIRRGSLESVQQDLVALKNGRHAATQDWLSARTLTAFGGALLPLALLFGGLSLATVDGSMDWRYCDDTTTQEACAVQHAVLGTAGTVFLATALFAASCLAVGLPLRRRSLAARRRQLADLDRREERVLHEAHGG